MIKYLSKTNLGNYAGKIALLRIDLNVEGNSDNFRLEAILPTIKLLLKHKIRVVLLSHKGRPKNSNRKLSLKRLAYIFSKKLPKKVSFIGHFDFKKIKQQIHSSREQIFLLENLRFLPGEAENSPKLARQLASLGDFYINEAFAVSHRKNASVVAITKFLPSYAGLIFEQEIKNLDSLRKHYKKPLTIIIGGAKIGEKLHVIEYFWKRADHFLLGGGPGITFFAAKKFPIGNSLFDKNAIPKIKKYVDSPKIILPTDVLMHKERIMDIGLQTLHEWEKIIKNSKTVIWNAPVGYVEKKKFARGSESLLRIIAKYKAFSVLGGGELTGLIFKMKLQNKFGFISTGGGAMLVYLSGEKMPGIEALK